MLFVVPDVANWTIEEDAAADEEEATLATIFAIVVAIARVYLQIGYIQ
jgi:hypothetical protein